MQFIKFGNGVRHLSKLSFNSIISPSTRTNPSPVFACLPHFYPSVFQVSKSRFLSSVPSCLWPSDLPPATEWGYGRKGPDTWPEKYPHAGGKSQSPVDILPRIVQSKEFDPPLSWKYGPGICKSVVNTGCGWRVDVQGNSELSGGPLEHAYELVQFHCHWGKESNCGSEHVVDGKSYAGELHFVHWNKELFTSCAEAVQSPKGLAVVGVFLELGEKNTEIEKLCETIPNIAHKDERIELECSLDPVAMFPANPAYWTYPGSLTTPPCYESVTWIMFKNPITVTEEQLDCFRHMKKTCVEDEAESPGFVDHNYRPPQLLNDREICECLCA